MDANNDDEKEEGTEGGMGQAGGQTDGGMNPGSGEGTEAGGTGMGGQTNTENEEENPPGQGTPGM